MTFFCLFKKNTCFVDEMATKIGSVKSKRPVYRRQNAVVEEPSGRNLVDNDEGKQSAFPRIYKPRCHCFCSLCTPLRELNRRFEKD